MEDYASLFNILLLLEYTDLTKLCSVNINANKLCNDNHFWKVKYNLDYDEVIDSRLSHLQWKDLYKYMYLLNLDYNTLLDYKLDNLFWELKYKKDFVLGDIIKNHTNIKWQNLYVYAMNVN